MAFGRSNSLSINTGAAASPFGNAAASNTQQPPPPAGGLFAASTATSQPQQPAGLFGASTSTSQPPQPGGLFGNASRPGGIFGSTNAAAAPTSQPQNTGGGMFGSSLANKDSPGLFGVPRPQPAGGLFANSTNQQPAILNPLGQSTARPLAGSLTMGQGNAPQQQQQQQQQTVPGARIDLSNLRPTTRFSDLHDDIKKSIESIDSFIRQQEAHCAQCEALMPMHSANVDSIRPDVDLITTKIETVELALENDGAAIDNAKALVQRDAADLIRVARMSENLSLPQQYHYGRNRAAIDEDYDVNLVGYFSKQAEAMQQTLDTYTSHLAEIEAHLRVVEASTIHQAQQLAAQRTGGRAGNSADTVRELAETLRGFESGILGAASLVGSCREGVNELILGKIGGDPRESLGYGGRRSVRF